jgi:hypothetical protein
MPDHTEAVSTLPYALRVFELMKKLKAKGVEISLQDIENCDGTLVYQLENIAYTIDNYEGQVKTNKK